MAIGKYIIHVYAKLGGEPADGNNFYEFDYEAKDINEAIKKLIEEDMEFENGLIEYLLLNYFDYVEFNYSEVEEELNNLFESLENNDLDSDVYKNFFLENINKFVLMISSFDNINKFRIEIA